MKTRLLLGAAVALAALVSPASASPPTDSHDLPFADCGFVVVNTDPTNPQSTHFEGTADCEAVWLTRNDPTVAPTTTHATVTVWLQKEANHDAGGVQATCVITSGPVGWVVVGQCQMAVTVAPSEPLYMCVKYTWTEFSPETGPPRHYSYTEDFDPVTPTKQCALAISA